MRIRGSLAAVFAVVGFLFVMATTGVDEARREGEPRRSGLVSLIRERQGEVERLGRDLAGLRSRLVTARQRLSRQGAADARRAQRVQMQAGTLAVEGPGVEVVLSDSERRTGAARASGEADALAVHDVDVQLVVNGLWAAGAEAVAVNGHRLVATSPVRGAGETITVNFRPLVPPFRISAIGADGDRFGRSALARQFRRFAKEFGLGFDVRTRKRLEIAGYRGTLSGSGARAEADG